MKIIITRPEPFASQLAAKLNIRGFTDVVCLPCMEISSYPSSSSSLPTLSFPRMEEECENDKENTTLLFISRNAVIYGHHLITTEKTAAIGLGTKEELEHYQKTVDIFPTQPPFNSEALLALPELLNVKNKKIVIIRGGEGRDLLFDTLLARGATVTYRDVYIRKKLDYSHNMLQSIFSNIENSLAICTSKELLHNLCDLTKNEKIDISRLQLGVISEKMAQYARMVGFSKPAIIANSPRDEDIIWMIQSNKNLSAND